jgi:DNA helicase-2/ATP-dependent DNA helicase PcrA
MYDREQLEEERRLMYVGMTRAKSQLRLLFARSRSLWGDVQANAPSRFLDDLPHTAIERRSDELLSAFAWATESGRVKATGSSRARSTIEPYRQQSMEAEFNQDISFVHDENQDVQGELAVGSRVRHATFGEGTVTGKRGDIVTIQFDSGKSKNLALSIAPLQIL